VSTEPKAIEIARIRAIASPTAESAHTPEMPGLREIFKLLPAALYTCEAPSGRITFYNAHAARLWGRAPCINETDEHFCGSFRLWRPDGSLLPHDQTPMAQAIRDGRTAHNEEVIIERPDGSRIAVVVNIDPIRDAGGRIVGAINVFHDTPVLQHTAQADAMLAAIVDSSQDAIVSKTLDGIIQSWNAGAERIFGYTPEEIIGSPVLRIIPPELHDEETGILEKIRKGERIEHFDTLRVAKDGRRIPVSLAISPVRDVTGAIVGASKVARDISERARADEALRDSERLLAAEALALAKLSYASTRLWRSHSLAHGLDEMLQTVIELLGADKGHIQLLNETGDVLTIVSHEGFEQPFLDHFNEVSADNDSACGRALRLREQVIIADVERDEGYEPFRQLARDAGYRAVVATPLASIDGSPLGMVSTHFHSAHRPSDQELRRLDLYCRQASDFIQRFRLEQTLRENEEALREADRRKDEFLALLAHELRNPLAPIRYALATTQKAGRTPDQQRRAEEIIERQVAHMSRLLDDLLDISRITRGTLELKKTPTELTVVIGTAIEAARPILDAKRHTLSLDLPKEAVRLQADPVRLAQVFSNLLINAAKYTDPGGEIHLRAVQQQGRIVVSVRDNGIGIAAEMMPRLFTLFSQAHTALDRSEGGLGVGLALVRGLVALHGGKVEARSEGPGRGSEFIVQLPLGTATVESVGSEPELEIAETGAALRILVVDDNKDAADTCSTLLELSGHQLRTAYTGKRAIEIAKVFHPHVVVLDIGLPDANGYDIARKMRAAPWGGDTVLVAVTGWGHEDDRRRAFDAGFDHHLTKPLAANVLESLINSIGASREMPGKKPE
jgi:PAS domain S-box-containing protein